MAAPGAFRNVIQHAILTKEWRTHALNRWLDDA